MSDTQTQPQPLGTDTLVKKTNSVVIDDVTYTVSTFCFAKTVKALALIAELVQHVGVNEISEASLIEVRDEVTGEVRTESNIIKAFGVILNKLPELISTGVPAVYALLGLIVVGNKELKRMEKADGVDVEANLRDRGEELAYEASLEQIMELVSIAARMLGTETIIKVAGPLLRAVMSR